MFFRSVRLLLVATLLIGVGAFQLVKAYHYREASRREVSTVGTILHVHHGRVSDTYGYRFEVSGSVTRDESGTCKTALTPAGCVEGAEVLVYYDPEDVGTSSLEDFGGTIREKLVIGIGMVACATITFAGLCFSHKKAQSISDERQ